MAPITATGVGMLPQIMDNEELRSFRDRLEALEATVPLAELQCSYQKDVEVPLEIDELVRLVEPYHKKWPFEEQVRKSGSGGWKLEALAWLVVAYPFLLLLFSTLCRWI